MQKQKYIGTNPVIWVVLILIAFMVVGQYQDAKREEAAAKQGAVQTTANNVH
jgi:hypothetical protein